MTSVAEAARRGDGAELHAGLSSCLPLGAAILEAADRPGAARLLRKVAAAPASDVPGRVAAAPSVARRADDAAAAAAAAGMGLPVPALLERLVSALSEALDPVDALGGMVVGVSLERPEPR